VRCDNNNNLLDSTPCINCLATLLDLNIKRIVFSHKDNTFMSCNPKDLTINHISSGANYLKKLNNSNSNSNSNSNNNSNNNSKKTNTQSP
jgi:deoxycytidylate deaminase